MSVEFEGNKACIAPEGVFIIGTYDEKGVPNAMNAAWGAQSDMCIRDRPRPQEPSRQCPDHRRIPGHFGM